MSQKKRRAAATATVGLAGVGGAGMLRHHALEESYLEKTPHPIKRPRVAAELRMLKHPKGRATWLTGAALGAVSIPPAAVGTHGLLSKRSIFREGYEGVRDSIEQRNQTFAEKPPAKLVAGNYLAGAAVGSGAGGLVHHTLDKTKLGGAKRSGLASIAGVVAGSATLPIQSKIIARASHGRYEATPTGVRRRKRKPVRPSAKAGIQPSEPVTKIAVRTSPTMVREGYAVKLPPRKPRVADRAGAKWTHHLTSVADVIEDPKPKKKLAGRLVATGRNKAGETIRAIAVDASSINDKDRIVREVTTGQHRIFKADPGGDMTRSQRRLRFTAAGGPPLVGDVTSALQAARLAPPARRKKVAAQQWAGNMGSGFAGNVAGGVGAAALATKHKGFEQAANKANDWVDRKVDRARTAVGLKPATRGPSKTAAAIERSGLPKPVRSVARMVASKPKVAAIGALAGGAIAGNVGSQLTYGRIMTHDDRYRKANQSATHGSRVIKGDPPPKPLSQREKKQLARRKNHSAAMSMMTGTTGLSALGATVGEKALHGKYPHIARHLGKVPVPALTIGAGIGGVNSFTNAAIQHNEARQAAVKKGLGVVRIRRAKGMRGAYLRQTRTSTGTIRVSAVRGGLG